MSQTKASIEIQTLHKRYGKFVAVQDLNLNIAPGTLFGFIGPNGAGKTTTLRMLAGLLQPTSGQIKLNNIDISQHPTEARWLVGYMPDFFGVYEDMYVWEYLDFFARCYRLSAQKRARVVDDLLDLIDLSHKRDAWVESLSRGMRQRLCLAHALVHDPGILLLDEPASGLDPRARVEMRELLKELSAMGKTIIISSHILSELAEMCDQIGIIEGGQLRYSGPVDEITAQLQGQHLIQLRSLAPAETLETALQNIPGISDFQCEKNTWLIHFQGDEPAIANFLQSIIQQNIPVTHFSQVNNNLESVFMQITSNQETQ